MKRRSLVLVSTLPAATIAGLLATLQPFLLVGAASGAALLYSLTALPPLLLAVAVHAGVWNTAPAFGAIGQEAPTLALIALTAVLAWSRRPSVRPVALVRVGALTALFLAYSAAVLTLGGAAPSEKLIRLGLFCGWGFLLAQLIGVDRRATSAALIAIVVAALLIAIASIGGWQSSGIPSVFEENEIIFGRSVGIGAVIAIGAALVVPLRFPWRIGALVVGIALTGMTVLSASRGAVVSVVAASAALMVLPIAGRSLRARISGLLILTGAGVLVVFASSDTLGFGRLSSLLQFETDLTAVLRTQSIEHALNQWLTFPVFGTGLVNQPIEVGVSTYRHVVTYPHNMLVETLSQTGVIGFLFVAAIFGLVLTTALRDHRLRNDPIAALLLAAFIFFLVSAQFSGDLQINRSVWTFAFFVAATPAWLNSPERGGYSPTIQGVTTLGGRPGPFANRSSGEIGQDRRGSSSAGARR